ncbi:MAG TPA: hypothetical protein VHW03_06740, partial [Chthoniobacterales bacterium]|nr:hypothetical protein [Chthoniobacterales bacterium]
MKPLPPDIARSLIYAPLPKYPVLASHRAHFGSGTQEPSSRMTGVTNALCRLHDAAGKVIAHRYPPKHRTQMFDDAA